MKQLPLVKLLFFFISIFILLFYYFSFYPGYISFDSAQQYSQVLAGEWNTISPIIMVILWTITDKVIAGPGGLFLLFLFIYWLGMLLFTLNLKINYWFKIAIIIVITLSPFNLMILPHLWKDVGLMAFLSLAIGLIQFYKNSNMVFSLYMALSALIIASLFRFESIVYIIIIAVYVIVLFLKHRHNKSKKITVLLYSFIVFLFSLLVSQALIKYSDSRKITLWQTVALWDLASVSVEVDTILLPSFVIGPKMTVADLATAVVPWTNTFLFWKTKNGMNSGLETPYKQEQYQQLFSSWLTMIKTYPWQYFTHRLKVANELLRFNESKDKPIDLFFSRNIHNYKESFALNNSPLNLKLTEWIKANKNNIFFKGWVYVLVEIILLLYLILSRKIKGHEFLIVLSASGVISALLLAFVVPAAEQRYLIWLVNSTFLAMALFLQKRALKE